MEDPQTPADSCTQSSENLLDLTDHLLRITVEHEATCPGETRCLTIMGIARDSAYEIRRVIEKHGSTRRGGGAPVRRTKDDVAADGSGGSKGCENNRKGRGSV